MDMNELSLLELLKRENVSNTPDQPGAFSRDLAPIPTGSMRSPESFGAGAESGGNPMVPSWALGESSGRDLSPSNPVSAPTGPRGEVTGFSTYSGGYKDPEDKIPLSPEIVSYLEGKGVPGYSDERRKQLESEAQGRANNLILPELVANLGSAISGTGGMAATPAFDRMRQNLQAPVAEFDKQRAAEQGRLMEIANYLRLTNRPQWEAEAAKARIDAEKARLAEQADYHNWMKQRFEKELPLRERGLAAREADVANKQSRWVGDKVAAYQDDLMRANIPEATAAVKAITENIPPTGDIPGWKAGQFLPDAEIPKEYLPGVLAIRALFNIELKHRSGSAVTKQELERMQGEFAAGKWATSDQLRAGIDNYIARLRELSKGVAGGYSPAVQTQYKENIRTGNPLAPANTGPPASSTQEKLLQIKQLLEKARQ